jgi:hypothetical protein
MTVSAAYRCGALRLRAGLPPSSCAPPGARAVSRGRGARQSRRERLAGPQQMHREAAACSGPPRKAATRLRRPRRAGGAPQSQGQLPLQGGQGTARCSAATAAGEARTEVTGDGGCDPSARGGAARSGLSGEPAAAPSRPAAQHRQARTGCTPRRSGPACRQGTAWRSGQHLAAGRRVRPVPFTLCETLHKPYARSYPRPTWGSPTPRPWPGRACRGSLRRRPPRPGRRGPEAQCRGRLLTPCGQARRTRKRRRKPQTAPAAPSAERRRRPGAPGAPARQIPQQWLRRPAEKGAGHHPQTGHQRGPRAPTPRSRSGQAARGAPAASPLPCPDQQQAPPGSGSAPRRFLLRRSLMTTARVDILALESSCARSPLPGCSQARRQL